jgi:shikimate dehydrogenase
MENLKLGVVGKDVSKSDSPSMHAFIAANMGNSITYDKISIPEDGFNGIVESLFKRYDGFNVTIPYKLAIIPHLEKVCGDAEVFGAVNTVLTSTRQGYNTDGLGFALMLKNAGVEVKGKAFLLLGAGGAGRSVAKKLLDGGATVYVYDRNMDSAKNVANEFKGVKVLNEVKPKKYYGIINATGIGMHKTVGISPVGADVLAECEVAIDLIYNPPLSEFLTIADSLGKKTVNGKAMLFYQAYYAQCIYFNAQPDDDEAKRLFEGFLKLNDNK